MSAHNRLLAIAAFTMWAIIQPGTVSAQDSGIGGDGFTRLLWISTANHMILWKLDQNLNVVVSCDYGAQRGFDPLAITTAANNNTYVLWSHTDRRSIALWVVDANLNFINSQSYPHLPEWVPKGLSTGGSSPNFHVIWESHGTKAVWDVDGNLNYVTSAAFQQP